MPRELIQRAFEIKATDATIDDNTIAGVASVMGNIDCYGDVIFPGAFKAVLKDFLQNGFVAVGHDWSALPVAMPTAAKESGNQLQTTATFHTHQAAQDARTVAAERIAAGKSVGLSVGFFMDYDGRLWFENGKKLLEFAKNNGYDTSLFDVKALNAWDDYLRAIIAIEELVEYSIVPKPANPGAMATDAKSAARPIDINAIATERDFERLLRDAGYSRKQATAITLHGFKALQRDAAGGGDDEQNAPGTQTNELTYRTLAARTAALATL